MKHSDAYVECATGVVYEIPLKCGRVYVGQTGRCINERAGEHTLSIPNKGEANLPAHCIACNNCSPLFDSIKILGRSKDKTAQELLEAYHIYEKGDHCISDTPVTLYHAEKRFLRNLL